MEAFYDERVDRCQDVVVASRRLLLANVLQVCLHHLLAIFDSQFAHLLGPVILNYTPPPLNGVQYRAVWRQKQHFDTDMAQKLLAVERMVGTVVVCDDNGVTEVVFESCYESFQECNHIVGVCLIEYLCMAFEWITSDCPYNCFRNPSVRLQR